MLTADVPYLEVNRRIRRWEEDCRNILAHRGHGLEVGMGGGIGGLYLFEEGGLASVVKTKEQDRVLCERRMSMSMFILQRRTTGTTNLLCW